jgi:hypothetical protein
MWQSFVNTHRARLGSSAAGDVAFGGASPIWAVGMKHVPMTQRSGKTTPVTPKKPAKTDAAFDIWLERGLHQMFDDVAKEPIPEELLRLIEEDRNK